MIKSAKFVPWLWELGSEHPPQTVLTQLQIPTYGATEEALQFQIHSTGVPGNIKWIGHCRLCVSDVALGWSFQGLSTSKKAARGPALDINTIKCNVRDFTLVEQHVCTRAHQSAVLSYKKGIRDALKSVAKFSKNMVGGSDDGDAGLALPYRLLHHECARLEEVLKTNMTDDDCDGRDANPTPETMRNLSVFSDAAPKKL